jgi:DNA-binding beta-propeller fold protein YncE
VIEEDFEMKTRMFRITILGVLFLSQILISPDMTLADFTPSNHQPATLVLGQPDFTSNGSHTSQSGMGGPEDVNVDPTTGKVFVADTYNHRVLRFASVYALGNGDAAEAVLGQADFVSGLPNRGGPVTANTMYWPSGIFVDNSGRLWVADLENNRVLRFDEASYKPNGANADGVLGQPNFTSDGFATGQNRLCNPADVFFDSGGRLWVVDFLNHRVLRFDDAGAKPNGANADGVLGQPNFTSSTSATTQNGMDSPRGVFLDSSGRLWVADRDNNRVLRFDDAAAKPNGAGADGVLGQTSFTSSAFACSQSGMEYPLGVGGDPNGRLFVADNKNNRVIIFENAAGLPNGANASELLGQPNFTLCTPNTGGISSASLFGPTRTFFDATTNTLWVADQFNDRVLRYGIPQLRIFLTIIRR